MSIPFGKDEDWSTVFKHHGEVKAASFHKWVRLDELQPGEARWNKALTTEEILALQAGIDPRMVASDYLYAYRPAQPEGAPAEYRVQIQYEREDQ